MVIEKKVFCIAEATDDRFPVVFIESEDNKNKVTATNGHMLISVKTEKKYDDKDIDENSNNNDSSPSGLLPVNVAKTLSKHIPGDFGRVTITFDKQIEIVSYENGIKRTMSLPLPDSQFPNYQPIVNDAINSIAHSINVEVKLLKKLINIFDKLKVNTISINLNTNPQKPIVLKSIQNELDIIALLVPAKL